MKLALGTVQFGMDYGVTNQTGQVPLTEVERILSCAIENGINILDTAANYGCSEKILGSFDLSNFKIISKLANLHSNNKYHTLREQVNFSLDRLNIDCLYGLLLHSEQDAIGKHADKIFDQLTKLKNDGLITKIGVSFYSPELAMKVINEYPINIIQIPSNILDNSFIVSGVLNLANTKNIEVHVRSLFLQGLLAVSRENRPENFKTHDALLSYDNEAERLELSKLELALTHLFYHQGINRGVVGCLNVSQLQEIIDSYHKIESLIDGIKIRELFTDDRFLTNPSLW